MKSFGKIAVASTFSPRFLPMLAEAKAFATLLGQPFEIIHAGDENQEDRDRFAHAFEELAIDGPIHWRQAEQPSDAIIQAVAETGANLLLAGAMERDSQGRYFLGKVARALILNAPCSLLLFANPAREPAPFRKLAVVVDYTEASRQALRVTLELAALAKVDSVYVLRVFTVFAQFLAETGAAGQDAKPLNAEEARLDAFVEEFDIADVMVITRCIEGTTGFAAADFVQSIEADLLVIASEPAEGHPHFPKRMEWLENVIPANLLVLRTDGNTGTA
jgi:nucleotide-binding universal stress UspA family protein